MQNVKIFEDNDFNVKAVIDLNVSDEISKQRVLSRNSGRSDDNEEVLNRRLKVFNTDTLQVFEYFKEKGLYRQIDASGTTDEVLNNSSKVLDVVFNQWFFMKISAILAVGKDGEIGLNGGLPWKCKEDLQHFKNITSRHCVLMGLNTYK